MRRQHNSDDGRDCWKTARERNRIKARFEIRKRVGARQLTVSSTYDQKLMHQILFRIVKGDRSFFSLKFLADNITVLSSPIPVDHCLRNAQGGIIMETMILSRWGFEKVQELKQRLEKLETCTFMEYAVSVGRYALVGSMLEGGINPCLRATTRGNTSDDAIESKELLCLGTQALKKFLLAVPLSLSSNIVKRVVEMRDFEPREGIVCDICKKENSPDLMLSYGPPCHHFFCESCFWKDLLDRIFLPSTSKAVICPVCSSAEPTCVLTRSEPMCYKKSLDLYLALPSDSKDPRYDIPKKGKIKDEEYAVESWSEAVAPSLGFNQAVRRDKFFTHVERGSFHFVKGCIDRGIDLHLRNEYGQTALFIATWFGYFDVVNLLLQSGSDPSIPCNAGITPIQVAQTFNRQNICELLADCSRCPFTFYNQIFPIPDGLESITLIDASADHPGAGSFIIDRAIDDAVADELVTLWQKLPVVESVVKKEKGAPCSVRSYYCDSLAWISSLLTSTLKEIHRDKQVSVFPHMRFLCYKDNGICLAKHVDLIRQHPFDDIRSTHSFLLYLSDCEEGGETTLLQDLSNDETPLATVKPKKSRLLCFPHVCPHKGEETVDVPKLLIRGEVTIA